MSKEFFAIIGVGVGLASLILSSMSNLRADFRAEMQVLREDMQVLRADMQVLRAETQAQFEAQQGAITGLEVRIAHLEGLVKGLREAITRANVAVVGALTGTGRS